MKIGALKTSPSRLTTEGKLAAAPVAMRRRGRGDIEYGSKGRLGPAIETGVCCWFAFAFFDPAKRFDERMRAYRIRKERSCDSSKHRGLARRSRNSFVFTPFSKRKIPLTCEKG